MAQAYPLSQQQKPMRAAEAVEALAQPEALQPQEQQYF